MPAGVYEFKFKTRRREEIGGKETFERPERNKTDVIGCSE
jgi:hypothetical protein